MAKTVDTVLVEELYGITSTASGRQAGAAPPLDLRPEVIVRDEGSIVSKELKDINFVGSGVSTTYDNASGKVIVAISPVAPTTGNTTISKQNTSGSVIPLYAVVSERLNGTVALATASTVQDEEAFGIALIEISNTGNGDIQTAGTVSNCLSGLGFQAEQAVYVGDLPGILTSIPPQGPGQLIYLVGYASGSAGQDLRLELRKIGRNSV